MTAVRLWRSVVHGSPGSAWVHLADAFPTTGVALLLFTSLRGGADA